MVGRAIIFFFFILGSIQGIAQKHPVLYTGMDLYRHTSFNENVYGAFNIGAQVYKLKFFAPEVGYSYYWGAVRKREIYEGDPNTSVYPDALFKRSFNSSVLSFTPKLKFGKEDAFLVISPTYNIGNFTTKGAYFINERNDGKFPTKEFQKNKASVTYWTFAVGFEGIQISSNYWFGLTINYNSFRANDNWDVLDFSEYDINYSTPSLNTLGFGLKFYFDPFASEND